MEAALNSPLGRTNLGSSNLTIGRVPGNSLVVNDPKASSHHAEIRPEGQGYSIIDLGSTNGTFVNEQRLAPHVSRPLYAGDRIRIGDTLFTYEASGVSEFPPTVYGGASSDNAGYQPTVAASSPYETPGYAANIPYVGYGQAPQQGYASPGQGYPSPEQNYQQPYSPYAPPLSPQPSYVPPAPVQPAKRGNRTLWIVLSIVGGVLLLACIAFGVLAYVAGRSTPGKTLDTFCNAIKSRDYPTAYDQFSTALKGRVSEAQFASAFSGPQGFSSCTYGSISESDPNASTSVTFTSTASGQPVTAPTALIQDSSSTWKIDSINFPNQSQ